MGQFELETMIFLNHEFSKRQLFLVHQELLILVQSLIFNEFVSNFLQFLQAKMCNSKQLGCLNLKLAVSYVDYLKSFADFEGFKFLAKS